MRKSAAALLVLLTVVGLAGAASETPDGPQYRGVEAAIDLPLTQRVRNFGAPRDGQGLCVFATLDMCARYQNARPLIDIIHKIERGGGWPEKVEQVLRQHAPGLELVQYQGSDPALLDLAIQTGRPVGVTYGYGDFYGGRTIAHMVLLAHLDQQYAAIIDNNDPQHWTWMSRAEFLKRWVHPRRQGWAYVLLAPPPPPVPRNWR